jgi:hypothetical protein
MRTPIGFRRARATKSVSIICAGKIDALVQPGTVDPANVVFISARFWAVKPRRAAAFIPIVGDGLQWFWIAEPGLFAKNGVIRISPDKTLRVSDGDFLFLRPLVNKYGKIAAQ